MTVKQALKEKNSLLKRINDAMAKVTAYNSIDEGNVRPYSTREQLIMVKDLTDELVRLKTRIHEANAPVYHKIFELSELKSLVKRMLRKLYVSLLRPLLQIPTLRLDCRRQLPITSVAASSRPQRLARLRPISSSRPSSRALCVKTAAR